MDEISFPTKYRTLPGCREICPSRPGVSFLAHGGLLLWRAFQRFGRRAFIPPLLGPRHEARWAGLGTPMVVCAPGGEAWGSAPPPLSLLSFPAALLWPVLTPSPTAPPRSCPPRYRPAALPACPAGRQMPFFFHCNAQRPTQCKCSALGDILGFWSPHQHMVCKGYFAILNSRTKKGISKMDTWFIFRHGDTLTVI